LACEGKLLGRSPVTQQPMVGKTWSVPYCPSGVSYDEAANRLGSWSGLMAQADHSAPADAFVPGDIKTARMFGRHVAESLNRLMVNA